MAGLRRFGWFFLFGLVAQPALAWSPQGHQVIAAIAAKELTPAARTQVAALLGGEALIVLDSSWADEVRTDRPETSPWHYVNIPIGSTGYDARRDCRANNCVVAQISRNARLLADPRNSRSAKTEALRFLIHFAADVHQPLHAADRHDRGGNDIQVRMGAKRLNLHQIWDQDVVAVQGRDAVRLASDILARLTPAQKAQMRSGTPEDWANQSFALASREIYAPLATRGRITLPPDYARKQSGLARLQMARAGLRLAALLNGIFR